MRFWAATFTQYGHRDVVAHDRVELGLVYDVVRDVDSSDDPRLEAAIRSAVERVERAARRGPVRLLPAATGLEPLARIRTHRGMREAFAQGLAAERLFGPVVRRALAAERLPLDLAALHEQFGSWPLALTAYNHGASGVERARAAIGSDDLGTIVARYESPAFGFASRSFYASFLAARHVLRNVGGYFPDMRPGRIVTYKVKRGDTLEGVARRHGVTIPSLRAANGIRAALIKPGQVLLVKL